MQLYGVSYDSRCLYRRLIYVDPGLDPQGVQSELRDFLREQRDRDRELALEHREWQRMREETSAREWREWLHARDEALARERDEWRGWLHARDEALANERQEWRGIIVAVIVVVSVVVVGVALLSMR